MISPESYTTPQAQELAKAFNAFINENFGSRKHTILYRSEALDTFIDTLRALDTHLTQQNRMLYAALHRGSRTFRPCTDCQGTQLHPGDCVSPVDHPGDHREAPVYTIHSICTDSETIQLRRADGSTLWRPAGSLLYLPETTAAALLNS